MSNSLFVTITALLSEIRSSDGSLQTEVFLHICRQIIPVVGAFTKPGSAIDSLWSVYHFSHAAEKFGTSFLIVRSDILGNIDRLWTRQQQDLQRYQLLYPIVLEEVAKGDTGSNSCTKGLLWLQRYGTSHGTLHADGVLTFLDRPEKPQAVTATTK